MPLTGRPRLRADYQPFPVDGHLAVVGEGRNLLIDNAAAAALAGLLDGTRTFADLAAALGDRFTVPELAAALRRMDRLGLLTDGPATVPAGHAAAWDARGVDPEAADRWLAGGRVVVVDAGAATAKPLADLLAGHGPHVERVPIDAPDLRRRLDTAGDAQLVVVVEAMTDPRLDALNTYLLEAGRSWTLVRPVGNVLVLGPHLRPGVTGCWVCLRRRWEDNEQVEKYLADRLGDRPRAARATLPPLAGVVAGLLAAELPVLAVTGSSARLTGRMITLDSRDLTSQDHTLVRQPQCPACGTPGPAEPTAMTFPPAPYTGAEGRAVTAEQTLERLSRHISPYLGVVTRVTPLDGNDNGLLFGFSAGHNFAQATSPVTLRRNLRGQSGGKGRTEAQARAGALGEAIERYCGVWRGDRPVHRASWTDLGPERAVHPRELLHFSDRQYAGRDRFNAGSSHFHRIPVPPSDDAVIDWSAGWSLTHDRPRALPASYCWYGHPEGPSDSNGSAAGNSPAEAVVQGFCELVERDAVALWWYHRSRVPGVDLHAFGDPWPAAVQTLYRRRYRRDLWLLDLTADLPIPVYAAVSPRLTGGDVLIGFGAHFDPAVAATRAITELNQFLPMVQNPADGSARPGITDPDTVEWLSTVRVEDETWLAPAGTRAAPASLATHDLAADVAACVRMAAGAGLEVIVLDQSRPDLELAVVKVIVPGLRHFWRRLGPGRLWEVPARLGRLPVAADESSANPRSVYF
ncbi:TOMM precursor leader peptide-binding protein [Actinoplanes sp. HUAS TT8]|uniref:TOMM precursor leader peptide-binding protein n=1 Tax=Actinoplanes sp. HUAS TT8 TaxID=3447453 RepID=UPI003F52417B